MTWEPPTDPVPEPPFTLDLQTDLSNIYLTIECNRCLWVGEVQAPVALNEVTYRADEHARRCNPG